MPGPLPAIINTAASIVLTTAWPIRDGLRHEVQAAAQLDFRVLRELDVLSGAKVSGPGMSDTILLRIGSTPSASTSISNIPSPDNGTVLLPTPVL